ncbi:glycerophosphodiester phosphodiesterase family protein, partial [Clostridium sp.]
VHVWTVNKKSELERMKMIGVDNIITDRPILAREVILGEENAENLLARLRALLR